MNEQLKTELREEIAVFEKQTEKFLNKELSVKEFKGYSGGFGSYAQRGGESFMLRLRMNQGIMTKDKLEFVVKACEQFHVTKAHFTTCQTIQLHDLNGSELPHIMSEALNHDIVCRGGGGDFPRNVMCSPFSGLDPQETFDVIPYAAAVGEYLLPLIHKYSLPRKLKIGFTNHQQNETHATFRDLGFVANSDYTFDVYCAGGLGNNSKMGVKVGHHIQREDILYYVSAMILIFMQHGNYENRAKARTRYLQETLGVEGLIREFSDKVESAMKRQFLKLQVKETKITKKGNGIIEGRRIIKQKQEGLFSVLYHPLGGTIEPSKLAQIFQIIQPMDDVEIRITPQQSIYIVNCTASEAQLVLQVTQDGAQNEFEESVSCIGAATCQVGIRDSQGTLIKTILMMREKQITTDGLPRIFISGCPSSCGTNLIGAIGFQGTVSVIDKKAYPAYALSLYGNEKLNEARFGEMKGNILEEDLCLFLIAIAEQIGHYQLSYEQWIQQHPQEIQEIVQEYVK